MSTPSESVKQSETKPFIPLSEPCLNGREWEYVKQCLDTGWVSTAGAFVERFEDQVAQYTGASFAVGTMNGTSALHAALLAAGVRPDDEVLVSTLTFIASANAISYTGAHPVFIDAEPQYWQLDPELVEQFLKSQCTSSGGQLINRQTGRRVAALMPVHILGHPVALDEILKLSRQYGIKVIEDAAESLGTRYRGRSLGTFGDVTCFSFNGNKTITAGAGGMIVTDQEPLAQRARYLTTQAKDDPVEYEHNAIGYNYRMSNVLAAIGSAQLEYLDGVVEHKRELASTYRSKINRPGVSWHPEAADAYSTYWLSTLLLDPKQCGFNATDLRIHLQSEQIQSRRLWRPMHQNPPYANSQAILNGTADRIAENALSLPSSVSLNAEDQQRVIEAVAKMTPTA